MKKVELNPTLESFENFAIGKKALRMVSGGTGGQLIVFEDYDGDGRDDTPEGGS